MNRFLVCGPSGWSATWDLGDSQFRIMRQTRPCCGRGCAPPLMPRVSQQRAARERSSWWHAGRKEVGGLVRRAQHSSAACVCWLVGCRRFRLRVGHIDHCGRQTHVLHRPHTGHGAGDDSSHCGPRRGCWPGLEGSREAEPGTEGGARCGSDRPNPAWGSTRGTSTAHDGGAAWGLDGCR